MVQLAEIKLIKQRKNLPFKEHKAIKDLRSNSEIVIKKADKGTTTVIMNTKDKTQEGQVLLDNKNNYTPLTTPMVKETARTTRYFKTSLPCRKFFENCHPNSGYFQWSHSTLAWKMCL